MTGNHLIADELSNNAINIRFALGLLKCQVGELRERLDADGMGVYHVLQFCRLALA